MTAGVGRGDVVALTLRVEATLSARGWHVELGVARQRAGQDCTELTASWSESAVLADAYAAAWRQLSAATGLPFVALADAMGAGSPAGR